MMFAQWPFGRMMVSLACLCVTGCGDPSSLRIETAIHNDGSCDRMIWQPNGEFLPENALNEEWKARWTSVVDAGRPDGDQQKHFANGSDDLIARGSFRSPDLIPAHYRYVDREFPDLGVSRLEHTYDSMDYGFVIEHRWTETSQGAQTHVT